MYRSQGRLSYIPGKQKPLDMSELASTSSSSSRTLNDMDNRSSTSASSLAGMWVCKICTYRNTSAKETVCKACLLPRGTIPLLSEKEKGSNVIPVGNGDQHQNHNDNEMFQSDDPSCTTVSTGHESRTYATDLAVKKTGTHNIENDASSYKEDVDDEIPPEVLLEDNIENEEIQNDKFENFEKLNGRFRKASLEYASSEATREIDHPEDRKYASEDAFQQITKKMSHENDKIENDANIFSGDSVSSSVISPLRDPLQEQQDTLKKCDEELEIISKEMERLEERQIELVERRMMIMTNITFLEQERIKKKPHVRFL